MRLVVTIQKKQKKNEEKCYRTLRYTFVQIRRIEEFEKSV